MKETPTYICDFQKKQLTEYSVPRYYYSRPQYYPFSSPRRLAEKKVDMAAKQRKPIDRLGPLRKEIVWEKGENSVNDVLDLNRPKKVLAYTTVLSGMLKLEKTGWLGHRDGVVHCCRSNAGFADTLLNLVPSPRPVEIFRPSAVGHRKFTKTRIQRILNSRTVTPITGRAWRISVFSMTFLTDHTATTNWTS